MQCLGEGSHIGHCIFMRLAVIGLPPVGATWSILCHRGPASWTTDEKNGHNYIHVSLSGITQRANLLLLRNRVVHPIGDRSHAYHQEKFADQLPMRTRQPPPEIYRDEDRSEVPHYYRISPSSNIQSLKQPQFPPRRSLQGHSFFDKMKWLRKTLKHHLGSSASLYCRNKRNYYKIR